MKTASKYVRAHGFKSVQELADFTGVQWRTLLNWWDNDKKIKSFKMLVTGAEVWKKEADKKLSAGLCDKCDHCEIRYEGNGREEPTQNIPWCKKLNIEVIPVPNSHKEMRVDMCSDYAVKGGK